MGKTVANIFIISFTTDTDLWSTNLPSGVTFTRCKYLQDLVTESKYYNMEINATKTKVMVVSRQERVQLEKNHGGQQLEQVQSFKFLGSYKTGIRDCTKDIKI